MAEQSEDWGQALGEIVRDTIMETFRQTAPVIRDQVAEDIIAEVNERIETAVAELRGEIRELEHRIAVVNAKHTKREEGPPGCD